MTDWLVDAVMLPDGTAGSRWLTASGWTEQRAPDAVALPGRFALPGLVDAHSHVSFSDGDAEPVFVDIDGAEAHRERYARDGVAIVRDAGGAPDVVLSLPRTADRPFVVAAGRHLAPPGMYFEGVHLPVEADDVVAVALGDLVAGATWAKLVADFPSAAARALAPGAPPEQTYDLDVVRRLIDAVHGANGRVAAHVTTPLASALVSLGIDSIEHGTALDEATVDDMASRGTAWTPTLCAVLSAAPDAPPERRRITAERRERFAHLLPYAIARGVPVLTGSDVVGTIPREIALLVECGVAPGDALRAATVSAVRFLGTDAEAAPASVVTYDADPREDPEVLHEPAAVVIGGVRVR
ncbi:MAG: amidohydrolase family protein [Candidatus Dormibacteraeota bacterium]|nr:amidohydrolase family protein [Candidatus Dormibacteraeota bacterium]